MFVGETNLLIPLFHSSARQFSLIDFKYSAVLMQQIIMIIIIITALIQFYIYWILFILILNIFPRIF